MNRLEAHSIRGCERPTGNPADRNRAALWRDRLCALFPGLGMDWLGDQPVRARYKSRSFADARVTDASNTAARITYALLPGAPDAYRLVLQLTGTGRYVHANREVIQEPGDLVLLDGARTFDSVFPSSQRVLVWNFPRELLTPLLAAPDRVTARRISGSHGPGAILSGYARTLAREAGRLDAPAQKSLLCHLCGLAALTLGADLSLREVLRTSYRATRRQQILTYIEAHLDDCSLSAERTAHDLGMSRRWLYTLFDEEGSSFAAWIAARRVEECRKFLDDPLHDQLTIASIAFHCGFNDLTTFNRRFRARYGMTPREARNERKQVRKV